MTDHTPEDVRTDYESIWCELHSDGSGYVEGMGVIFRGADVPDATLLAALREEHGSEVNGLVSAVQHLNFMPRVKWCSKYDGWGCENEGEWHAHWIGVRHQDGSNCCHTLALPLYLRDAKESGA